MADNSSILSDFGINILEEEIDDVISRPTSFCATLLLQAQTDLFGGSSKCVWHSQPSSPSWWQRIWLTR